MPNDYSHQNLRGASLREKNLSYANFDESDLRGTDFTGSDLTGAKFIHVKTGIPPGNKVWIFIAALIVSAFSGYVAMQAGSTVQTMLYSGDPKLRISGIIAIVLVLLFFVYCWWKGGTNAIRNLVIPVIIVALTIGVIARIGGLGTGMGMLYLIFAIVLTAIMFVVGTIARTAAGSLSNILFMVVALAGGLFSKSLGGGIGTAVMAISCALISKRALSGVKGFEFVRKIVCWITSRFGTSFRNSKLAQANFSKSVIHNSDFSEADLSKVEWGDSKKMNCIINENWTKGDGSKK